MLVRRRTCVSVAGTSWVTALLLLPLIIPALSISAARASSQTSAHPEYLHSNNHIVRSQDRFCGPYSVWYALNWCGKQTPIDTLVREMQADDSYGTTMASIVTALRSRGVQAEAVRLDLNTLTKIDVPFIPYTRPADGNIGHFVFCLPAGGTRYLRVDGLKEPREFVFQDLKDLAAARRWDGTVVLVLQSPLRTIIRRNGNRALIVGGVLAAATAARVTWLKRSRSRSPLARKKEAAQEDSAAFATVGGPRE